MDVTIFTQDDRLYLPRPIEAVVRGLGGRVKCIVVSPVLSTHGSRRRGVARHLPVFGVRGTLSLGARLAWSHVAPTNGLRPRSIADVGARLGVPTYRVERVNSPAMRAVLDRHPTDLLISIACPQVVRARIRSRFPRGGINVHCAPLPRYRGLMPAFWTLLHGETETAVTVHELADRIDDGAILLQRPLAIRPGETWNSLVTRTKALAGVALVDAVLGLEAGTLQSRPNRDEDATYFTFPTWRDAIRFHRRGLRMFG
jgi:methionyl-tRNA formyltransferase